MERETAGRLERLRPKLLVLAGAVGLIILGSLAWAANQQPAGRQGGTTENGMHHGIASTIFWIGEGADISNQYIHNRASTWTEDWVSAYGGIDDPEKRCGFLPCGFTPKENPFYFALPYSDLDGSCGAKPSQSDVPWYDASPPPGTSVVKNRWIEIRYGGKTAYAQWEDAGPFGEDDIGYVFGQDPPAASAGLDLSPALAQYLGLKGSGQTDWRFVTQKAVTDGPWLKTITTSPPDCAK